MALRKQKGNMYAFVTATWNPIKGECSHQCRYCHPKDTIIMMGDYSGKKIKDVNIGDSIIGLELTKSGFYRFARSKVINKSTRESNTISICTMDGKIECTPEHPLMGSTEKRNCSDWKEAKSFSPYENLRYISKHSRGDYNKEHWLGYIKGFRDGDGCVFKTTKHHMGFEAVCVDKQLKKVIKRVFKEYLNISLSDGIKRAAKTSIGNDCSMIFTRKTKEVKLLEKLTQFRLNDDFSCGYIAGMIDSDGSVGDNKTIRIAQSKTVNNQKYNNILDCLNLINIDYKEEKNIIRIRGSFRNRMKVLFECGVFHESKSDRILLNSTYKGATHSMVRSITASGKKNVYNLQTECGNFIANGFIVHNCYMKDFDLPKLYLAEHEMNTDLSKENFIFVGSGTDVFADDVPKEWIVRVLEHCRKYPDTKYLFQTKNPKRFNDSDFEFPPNSVFGTTIETDNEVLAGETSNAPAPVFRALELSNIKADKMVTIEPIMDFNLDALVSLIEIVKPSWINIGADSKGNNLKEPSWKDIHHLIAKLEGITKIVKKSNLKRLMG